MARLDKFSKKYGFFLSDASNEEIVSISKELSEEMSNQIKSLNVTALSLMAISTIALMFCIFLISSSEIAGSSYKTMIFFLRIASVVFMCISVALGFLAVSRALRASSISPLMWRNVRETANDEKVYEQMMAVNTLNKIVFTGKNNVRVSALFIVLGGIALALAYAIGLFAQAGYI